MERICEVSDEVLRELAAYAHASDGRSTDPAADGETAACPVDSAYQIARKALENSCGKGVMCRDGMRQIYLIIQDIVNGKGESDDMEMLRELLGVILECADCDLSYTAAQAILSLLENYQDDWRMHITRKRCVHRVCDGCAKPEIIPQDGAAGRRRRRGTGKLKKMEADVVVIACGMSGLAALTQAQESLNASGGGVAVAFEKSGTSGGAANMGMALLAFESQLQKEAMVNDFTKDDAFRFFMEYVHWRSNARLVRRWFEQSSETIEWLQDKGVEFLGVYKYFKNSHCTQHMVKAPGSNKPSERCASIMNRILTEYAQEIGAEIYFNTPVRQILTGSKGQVRGVIAVDASGEEIECLCNSVIVATGGIGNNVDMIYEHMGWKWGEDMFTFRIPGIDGDGLNMAWDIGAKKAKINMEVTYNTPGTTDIFKTLSETMRQPNLMVNLNGKRFINEEIMDNTTYTGNSLLQQKGHTGFSIIDSTIVDYYKKHGLDYITYHHAIKTMDKWDEELDLYLNNKGIEANGLSMLHEGVDDQESGQTNFWKFDTLEELCETTGINYKNLKKTIADYNEMCNGSQRGYDWEFTKDHRFLKPVLKPPYYVARHFPSGYGSLGGLEVNENMEVLNNDLEPIPGLYACGNDTATIFADSYCFYNPGSTMSYAVNSGRIAAKEAVAYMDSEEFMDPEA